MLAELPGITEVDEAADGDEALAQIARLRPDVVVLDLHLPGRNGLAVLAELRSAPARPRCVVLTNDATEHHRRESRLLGADYFFDKSTQFEDVLSLIAELAAKPA